MICRYCPWALPLGFWVVFSLSFTRHILPSAGGVLVGLGSALPSLHFKSAIRLCFRTGAGLNFGKALKSAGNMVATPGRGWKV